MKVIKIDKNTDRFEYYDKTRRISNNELNAALRNLIEEQRLQMQLLAYKSELKYNNFNQQKETDKAQKFIKHVQTSTGNTFKSRDTHSAKNEKSNRTKSSHGKNVRIDTELKKKNFMQLLCESSSTMHNQSAYSFDVKPHKDHMSGTSYNYNDILEISDTSESDEEFGGIFNKITLLGLQNVKNNKAKLRPMTTNGISSYNDTQMHAKRDTALNCRTAPISSQRSGFKTTIEDDSNLSAWVKYKKNLAKAAKKGKAEIVFNDEKLERKYFEILQKKNKIPHHTPEEISELRKRDPIFAKRHNQFLSAKRNGKAANYDENDINSRVFMPKWSIQKQKCEMQVETRSELDLLRIHNRQNLKLLDDKVQSFVKKYA